MACEKKLQKEEIQSLISSNLLKDGDIDPKLLIGEWDLVRFAYTTDGNIISNVADITIDPFHDIEWIASQNGISIDEVVDMLKPKLKIPDPPCSLKNESDDPWVLSVCNISTWICSLSSNLISLKNFGSTLKHCPNSAENDVCFSLINAHSFVIRNDELIIHFTGDENKNLLILKKRKS